MELYVLTQIVYSIIFYSFRGTARGDEIGVIWGTPIGVGLYLGLFLLQAFGLSAMAKRRGISKRFLAFIPFVNIYYLGKIAGECSIFGHKVKRAWISAMVAQILAFLMGVALLVIEWFLYKNYGRIYETNEMGWAVAQGWENLSAGATKAYDFTLYGSLISLILDLASSLLTLVLLTGLYKSYAPGNYRILGIVYFFMPFSRFIAIFVLRKAQPVNYDEYVLEQLRRRREYYSNPYNNPYGNPYGNPNNRYGNPPPPYGAPPSQTPPVDEPFDEFSSNAHDAPSQNGDSDGDSDGFFD